MIRYSTASAENAFAPDFYAFYNGVPELPLEEEGKILKELGYSGISQIYGRDDKLAERVAVYQKLGVCVLSVYQPATDEPVREEAVRPLAKGGFIELTVPEKTPGLVSSLRQTAEMAARLEIKVVIYPHSGFSVATMAEALELVNQVDHPNLGVMFNLCHYLKSEKIENLEETIERAGTRLFLVSTNGADANGENWKTLIQTLDQGTFSQERLLKSLKKTGYQGPITLQCYNIPGDKRENLRRSMEGWQQLIAELKKNTIGD